MGMRKRQINYVEEKEEKDRGKCEISSAVRGQTSRKDRNRNSREERTHAGNRSDGNGRKGNSDT